MTGGIGVAAGSARCRRSRPRQARPGTRSPSPRGSCGTSRSAARLPTSESAAIASATPIVARPGPSHARARPRSGSRRRRRGAGSAGCSARGRDRRRRARPCPRTRRRCRARSPARVIRRTLHSRHAAAASATTSGPSPPQRVDRLAVQPDDEPDQGRERRGEAVEHEDRRVDDLVERRTLPLPRAPAQPPGGVEREGNDEDVGPPPAVGADQDPDRDAEGEREPGATGGDRGEEQDAGGAVPARRVAIERDQRPGPNASDPTSMI